MAHTFTLTVKASGAAFHDEDTDEYDPCIELARILRSTAENIRDNYRTKGAIVDSNGNVVGKYELTEES